MPRSNERNKLIKAETFYQKIGFVESLLIPCLLREITEGQICEATSGGGGDTI